MEAAPVDAGTEQVIQKFETAYEGDLIAPAQDPAQATETVQMGEVNDNSEQEFVEILDAPPVGINTGEIQEEQSRKLASEAEAVLQNFENNEAVLEERIESEVYETAPEASQVETASKTDNVASEDLAYASSVEDASGLADQQEESKIPQDSLPVQRALFSKSPIEEGAGTASIEEVQNVANEFMASYNGNIPLRIVVKQNQEEHYGPDGSVEKIGPVKGSYHPKSGVLALTVAHWSSRKDGRNTLRHEVLGHFGLNTFKPEDKRALLDKILASKNQPRLAPVWDYVTENYKDASSDVQAEEVFAHIAEKTRLAPKTFF